MATAYRLARAETNTPVSYWMALPIGMLSRWLNVIVEVQQADKKG